MSKSISFRFLAARPTHLPLRSTSLASRATQASHTRSNLHFHVPARQASQWGPRNPRRPPRYNRFSNVRTLWYTSPAFRYGIGATGAGVGVFYYANLEEVPISGRRRFNCFSSQFEEQLGQQSMQAVLQEFRGRVLPPNHPQSKMVNRVLQRLIPASGMEHLHWEVRVIDDPDQINAFVMPGGKVFVFSGILRICGGDDELAAVLGHEISHQLAHHNAEKLSQQVLLVALAGLAAWCFDVSGQVPKFILDLVLERPGSRKMEVRK